MAYRYVSGSRGTWNESRETTFVGPGFDTTAGVIEAVSPYRYLGINAVEQLAVALPVYSYYSQPHNFLNDPWVAPARPVQDGSTFFVGNSTVYAWEPDLYWGKPLTIVTRPKACVVLIDFSIAAYAAFDFNDIIDAITDTVAATANALGVHIYLAQLNTGDGSYLTRGLLLGGSTQNPDGSSTASLPSNYPIGDLLIMTVSGDAPGFGIPSVAPAIITVPDADYPEVGWYSAGMNGRGAVAADVQPYSYFAFVLDGDGSLPTMLSDDQALMADYENGFPTFRHVAHPVGGSGLPIFFVTDGSVSPVVYTSTAPGGFPPTAADYYSEMVGTLNNFQLGTTIDALDYANSLASALLANILDFFS